MLISLYLHRSGRRRHSGNGIVSWSFDLSTPSSFGRIGRRFVREHFHNGYIKMVSPQCELSDVFEDNQYVRKLYHNGYIGLVSPQCEFSYTLQEQ